jgi:hypothetical protein
MEHHLGFWPIPLLRGRNRGSRRGCRWNLTVHYSPAAARKIQYFRELPERARRAEWGTGPGERSMQAGGQKIVRPHDEPIHPIDRKPNRISGEPVYNRNRLQPSRSASRRCK